MQFNLHPYPKLEEAADAGGEEVNAEGVGLGGGHFEEESYGDAEGGKRKRC
jgi:hypothetical protein